MSDAQSNTPTVGHRAIVQPDRDWLSVVGGICTMLLAVAAIIGGVWLFVRDQGAADVSEETRIATIEKDVAAAAAEETSYRTKHENDIKEKRGQTEAVHARTGQRLDNLESSGRTQAELIDRLSYRMATQEAQTQQFGATLAKITETLADQRTESARQTAEIIGQISALRELFQRFERQADESAPPPQKPSR